MAIDESGGDGRRVADITSGLQGLKHEARLKEVKYLEVVWLCGSEEDGNYSRCTLQTGEGWRDKTGVRQRR